MPRGTLFLYCYPLFFLPIISSVNHHSLHFRVPYFDIVLLLLSLLSPWRLEKMGKCLFSRPPPFLGYPLKCFPMQNTTPPTQNQNYCACSTPQLMIYFLYGSVPQLSLREEQITALLWSTGCNHLQRGDVSDQWKMLVIFHWHPNLHSFNHHKSPGPPSDHFKLTLQTWLLPSSNH